MQQKKQYFNGLSESERNLSFEERNKIFQDEIKNFGFIRDCRLACKNDVPPYHCIEFEFDNNIIKFKTIPKNVNELYFVINEKKIEIFDWDEGFFHLAYANCEVLKIKKPKLNIKYNLAKIIKNSQKLPLGDSGNMYFGNSIGDNHHFTAINTSIVKVVILRDGYLRFDLKNTNCDTISFRSSECFENAFDLIVDDEMKQGDVFFTGIRSGMVIYHPPLAAALKNQAILEPFDMNNGIFYAEVTFGYSPTGSKSNVFIDLEKIFNNSSHIINYDYFNSPKIND